METIFRCKLREKVCHILLLYQKRSSNLQEAVVWFMESLERLSSLFTMHFARVCSRGFLVQCYYVLYAEGSIGRRFM